MFTIPAHIPPPPQYCSASCNDLSPTQHALQHSGPQHQHHVPCTMGSQHSASRPPVTQHPMHQTQGAHQTLQRSSPLQHCLQRSSSLEQCAGHGLIPQPCVVRASPPMRPQQHHGTPAAISLQHPTRPQIIYTTGTDTAMQGQQHPGAIHYVQPHAGLMGDTQLPTGHHMGLGLVPSHLPGGPPPQQRTLVSQDSIEHPQEPPIIHSSPKSRAKHVTWTGGSTHGEESAV